MFSRCATRGSKNSRFNKKQKVSGILINLDLKTPSNKITSLGEILVQNYKPE